jgi:DNA-binding IclR family transcriptional regulator
MIASTRARGFSVNDGRIVTAMAAVGVPVLNASGRAIAALSIASIRERMAPPRDAELVALLSREAEELGRRLSRDGVEDAARVELAREALS